MSDKREKILQGALKLFTQKGIDSTSTASIAKEAGVGTGTVFHYFSNKEELVNECYIHVKQKLRVVLESVKSDNFLERTHLFWQSAIEWYLDHKMEAQFLNIYQHDPKVNDGKSLSITIEMSGLIMSFLEDAKRQGQLKDFSVEYFCLLASESTMLAAQYLSENPKEDKAKFIKSSCDFFLAGILAK